MSRNTVIEVDISHYVPSWDDCPIDEEDARFLCDDITRARAALSAATPNVSEALLRLERCLPLLTKLANWKP